MQLESAIVSTNDVLVKSFGWQALFVLNTRSLASYARSKVAWETARTRRGLPSAPCATGDAPDGTNRTSSAEGNLTVHPNRSALSYGLLALKVTKCIRPRDAPGHLQFKAVDNKYCLFHYNVNIFYLRTIPLRQRFVTLQ